MKIALKQLTEKTQRPHNAEDLHGQLDLIKKDAAQNMVEVDLSFCLTTSDPKLMSAENRLFIRLGHDDSRGLRFEVPFKVYDDFVNVKKRFNTFGCVRFVAD